MLSKGEFYDIIQTKLSYNIYNITIDQLEELNFYEAYFMYKCVTIKNVNFLRLFRQSYQPYKFNNNINIPVIVRNYFNSVTDKDYSIIVNLYSLLVPRLIPQLDHTNFNIKHMQEFYKYLLQYNYINDNYLYYIKMYIYKYIDSIKALPKININILLYFCNEFDLINNIKNIINLLIKQILINYGYKYNLDYTKRNEIERYIEQLENNPNRGDEIENPNRDEILSSYYTYNLFSNLGSNINYIYYNELPLNFNNINIEDNRLQFCIVKNENKYDLYIKYADEKYKIEDIDIIIDNTTYVYDIM